MRVGVVGCGRVAEHHLRHIRRSTRAEVVGVVDSDPENLRRFGSKYGISNVHHSLESLMDSTPLDVVHICTPPFDHFTLAQTAIRRGVHVLVEKPIAFSHTDVSQLYEEAAARGVLLCPNFIQLFHPAMMRAIKTLQNGDLGQVIHCVCNYGTTADDPVLREALGLHWVYRLPGGVLHNHLTHPLYLALLWTGNPIRTVVTPKSFGTLPHRLPDHLEISLEGERCTAQIILTMAERPSDYYVTMHCERGVVTVNFRAMTVVIERSGVWPGAVERLTSGIRQAGQLSREFVANTADMALGRLVPYQGLGALIPQFYQSIENRAEPPVPPKLAVAVSAAEEAVLAQTGPMNMPLLPPRAAAASTGPIVAVTGAPGFLGREVVAHLIKAGYAVRALARPQSHTDALERLGAEVVYGDVRDPASLRPAFAGASIVIHLAAGMRGSERFMVDSTVTGTANVAAAARECGVGRVIYTSSVSVYDFAAVREGGIITEDTPLDSRPELRGTYSMVKRKADDIALRELSEGRIPWTILRPAVIFGEGHAGLSLAGSAIGPLLICFGRSGKQLRLIHAADVADVIVHICRESGTAGHVFNLAHPEALSVKEYLRECFDEGGRKPVALFVPRWAFACAAFGLRQLHRVIKKAPQISTSRVTYNCRGVRVSSDALREQISWTPSMGLKEQLQACNRAPRAARSAWQGEAGEVRLVPDRADRPARAAEATSSGD